MASTDSPGSTPPRVLVADDERIIREVLREVLLADGFDVLLAADGDDALGILRSEPCDLLLTDLKMPRMGGLQLLGALHDEAIDVLTVVMTGFGTVETAIAAMKQGAYDYLLKPFQVDEVVHVARRAIDRQRLQRENVRLRQALALHELSERMSTSLALDPILDLLLQAAEGELRADAVALLLEETPGSGRYRERLARAAPAAAPAGIDLDPAEVLRRHAAGKPLVAHGPACAPFFRRAPDAPPAAVCAVPLAVQGRVVGLLAAASFTPGRRFAEGQRRLLGVLAHRAAAAIDNARLYESLLVANADLAQANASLEENFRQTIVGLANALEASDPYTRGHSERVAAYARMIAEALRLPEGEIDTVVLSAQVHDIGKIGIPTDKLNKPGPLTPEERAIFNTHPEKGRRILEPVPFLRKLVPGALCHHEAWDGSGYPAGLAGEGIPLIGRIVAVADAFDAMTSHRAYRRALPLERALGEIARCAGTQFDPAIARLFLKEIGCFQAEADRALAVAARAAPAPQAHA